MAKISRRSTRIFTEQEVMESGNAGTSMVSQEIRRSSGQDEKLKEKDKQHREGRSSSHQSPLQALAGPVVDVGRDLGQLFPSTTEGVATQGNFI